jgi:single-strand DNA-binding protein
MIGVNSVTLVGNIGDYTYSEVTDTPQFRITLATNERRKDEVHTEWHKLVAWGGIAKAMKDYCTTGTGLYVEGKLRHRSHEKDGEKRYITEVVVDKFIIMNNNRNT